MVLRGLWLKFLKKLREARPFLRTKIGSRLALLGIADFIALFFAPLMHGFAGAALFGCVASVYLVLIWRRYDRPSAIVPAVLLSVPMALDMLIYGVAYAGDTGKVTSVITALLVAIAGMYTAARSRVVGYLDRSADMLYVYLAAGAMCLAVVAAAWILNIVVILSWWILCIIAFIIVVGIFMGVVFSTAAYTASDGRRQAIRRGEAREKREEEQQKRYSEYRPRERSTKVYNLDDDDVIDIDE